MKGRALLLAAVPAALLAWSIWPLLSGSRTLFLRDILNTHLLLRAHLARELPEGRVPTLDPLRSGGQPLAGNPNALPWYPDNVLLLLGATPLGQLNAHFWLHWLLGTCGIAFLARELGSSREGSVAAAASWAFSGYWFSQMNLANAVAPIALAPWLAAFARRSGREGRAGRGTVGLGVFWGLELLGGDPALAVLAGVLAAAALLGAERSPGWIGRLALALSLGTCLAAPQLVESARIAGDSFRVVWGYEEASPLRFGPDPRQLLDLLLPLFFGRPDLGVDWLSAAGGPARLYYSLAPGLGFLALAWVGRRPAAGPSGWSGAAGLGRLGLVGVLVAFFWPLAGLALGSPLPGTGFFRYPVKFLLWTAVALALGCARGCERLLAGVGRRPLLLGVGAAAALEIALWWLLSAGPSGFKSWVSRTLAPELGPALLERELVRWGGTALLQVLALVALLLVAGLFRKAPTAVVASVLAVSCSIQLLLHRPLLASDERAFYERPPDRLRQFPAEAVLCHGAMRGIFGEAIGAGVDLPDGRLVWVARRAHERLHAYPAPLAGRRIECAVSPEGLDSFFSHFLALAMMGRSDAERVRVLRALGVDYLLLERPLRGTVEGVEQVAGPEPDGGGFAYRIEGTLGEAQLLGAVEYAPSLDRAFARLVAPDFDPTRLALLPGSAPARVAPPGRTRILEDTGERLILQVDSEDGGVLVLKRAFLSLWQARIDGKVATPVPAQGSRLAVLVPPGRHEVVFFLDPRPRRGAVFASFGAGILAVVLATRRAR